MLVDFFEYIIKPYKENYSYLQIGLELIAVCFGFMSVGFAYFRNILVYPTGLVSTILYTYLLFNWGLYGDMMINFYYTIMSLYGWVLWYINKKDAVHVSIEIIQEKDKKIISLLFIFSFLFVLTVYYFRPVIANDFNLDFLSKSGFHFSLIDYIDSFTSSVFLIGMWLMAKRKIENWLFWIIGNFISIPLYIVKGYALTSFQYTVFLILAILGYLAWKKELKPKLI